MSSVLFSPLSFLSVCHHCRHQSDPEQAEATVGSLWTGCFCPLNLGWKGTAVNKVHAPDVETISWCLSRCYSAGRWSWLRLKDLKRLRLEAWRWWRPSSLWDEKSYTGLWWMGTRWKHSTVKVRDHKQRAKDVELAHTESHLQLGLVGIEKDAFNLHLPSVICLLGFLQCTSIRLP